MFNFFKKRSKSKSQAVAYNASAFTNPLTSKVRSSLAQMKRDALRKLQDNNIDSHLFTLYEEVKTFSVLPQNSVMKTWQYPFLSIEKVEIEVVQAESGGVVMKFITAKLFDHKIRLGFGVFPKSESDFKYSTNALHLSIDDQKYIAATFVIRFSESGRNWRVIDIEEFHNIPAAEPMLRQFSELVEKSRVTNNQILEEEQLEAYQKKFTF